MSSDTVRGSPPATRTGVPKVLKFASRFWSLSAYSGDFVAMAK